MMDNLERAAEVRRGKCALTDWSNQADPDPHYAARNPLLVYI